MASTAVACMMMPMGTTTTESTTYGFYFDCSRLRVARIITHASANEAHLPHASANGAQMRRQMKHICLLLRLSKQVSPRHLLGLQLIGRRLQPCDARICVCVLKVHIQDIMLRTCIPSCQYLQIKAQLLCAGLWMCPSRKVPRTGW